MGSHQCSHTIQIVPKEVAEEEQIIIPIITTKEVEEPMDWLTVVIKATIIMRILQVRLSLIFNNVYFYRRKRRTFRWK